MAGALEKFTYPGPAGEGGRGREEGRTSFLLCETDNMISTVQVMNKGNHNRMHSHRTEDGYWYVLGGRATFYGEGDRVMAELGPNEGILVPCGTRYWFESTGEQPLELLRVTYKAPAAANGPGAAPAA
jgi:mannose-6-phosphate isomerase-like protein (cupin superfamily)